MGFSLEKNEVILFQGDSITDCSRNKFIKADLGHGYASLINHKLQEDLPDYNITCYNRGVWGNRVINLKRRWYRDCLKVEPTLVSILIGINDTRRKYKYNKPISVKDFGNTYKFILNETRSNLKDTKLVLIEPFVLPDTEDKSLWYEDLSPKIEVIRNLSKDFNALYLPLSDIFHQAMKSDGKGPLYWTSDGIHPTEEGHKLIARKWLDLFNID